MGMNSSAIRDVFHAWFAAASGLAENKVIWARQPGRRNVYDAVPANVPRPAKPYAALSVIAGPVRRHHDDQRMPVVRREANQMYVAGQRLLTLSCQTFGPGALDYLDAVLSALYSPTKRALLQQAQETTVVVTTASDDTDYGVSVDEESSTVDSGVGATKESIRDALVAKVNAAVLAAPSYYPDGLEAEADAVETDRFTITAHPGIEFDVAVTDGDMDTPSGWTPAVGLAALRDDGVVDLTERLAASFEERAGLDVIFNSATRATDDPSTIEKVTITNELNDDETFDVEANYAAL